MSDRIGTSEDLKYILAAQTQIQLVEFDYWATSKRIAPEFARHTILISCDLTATYRQDVEILTMLLAGETLTPLQQEAAAEILASRKLSLDVGLGNHPEYASAGKFEHIAKAGLDIHSETGTVSLLGLEHAKFVIQAGQYKPVNSKALTIAKNEISRMLPTSKIRRFNLPNVRKFRLNGKTLVIESHSE